MEQTKVDNRMYALDGIRGIAIVLVVLTHVNSSYVQSVLPPLFARIFFSSGVTGVSLLFILSGFFMALMYPDPRDRIAFVQKRYTRIFPLFLMMCLLTVIVRITAFPWYQEILTFVGLALLFHVTWVYGVKRFASDAHKRVLFLSFVGFQALIGAVYYFAVMRLPVAVFANDWTLFAREAFTGLVNGTLTLPLGNYIPMIDGVYWSLAAEVLFYVLYVYICVPVINALRPSHRMAKLALLLLLIPFFGGLHVLSTRLLGLSLLRPEFGYYFVTGIVLGHLYRYKQSLFTTLHSYFPEKASIIPVLFFFACVMLKDQSFQYVSRSFDPWLHILWAIPMTLAVAFALDPETRIAALLRSKTFVLLGTISYSMYLSHSLTLHLLESIITVHDVMTDLVYILSTLVLTVVGSLFLYKFLEKPYFDRRSLPSDNKKPVYDMRFRNPTTILATGGCFILVVLIVAYQSNFNFFSVTAPVEALHMIEPTDIVNGKVDMTSYPLVAFEFTSTQDSLGVLTTNITHTTRAGTPGIQQRLTFSIKESTASEWYATNTYDLEKIGIVDGDPFGFPVIKDASGKQFYVEFQLLDSDARASAILDVSSVKGVYTTGKKEMLVHPLRFFSYTTRRVWTALSDPDAMQVLLFVFPAFIVVAGLAIWSKQTRSS